MKYMIKSTVTSWVIAPSKEQAIAEGRDYLTCALADDVDYITIDDTPPTVVECDADWEPLK